MTEQEWLACTEPGPMLDYLRGKTSDRRLRLFIVACCRRVWEHLRDPRSRAAVEMGEEFADGRRTKDDLFAARNAAKDAIRNVVGPAAAEAARAAVRAATRDSDGDDLVWYVAKEAKEQTAVVAWNAGESATPGTGPDARRKESQKQAVLLKHIIGNPFHPYRRPEHWPSSVVHLSDALYNGQDCTFALHDALLEAGHPELADHFRQEQRHPKGCWVLDLILQKK